MPTYTKETRQLYVRKSAHEKVREYAETNHQNIEEVYRRLIGEVATTPGTAGATKEPKVRATPRIPDAVWDVVQNRALAEGVPIGTLVEQRIGSL